MSQNTAIRTTGTQWDFLEPIIHPDKARTIHGKITAASSSTTVVYPKGQVLAQKNDLTNEWAKIGTSGFGGPGTARPRVLKYPIVVDDQGHYQIGGTFYTIGGDTHEDSVDMYYQGFFRASELTGGTGVGTAVNEVQTETVTATGGTRTLTVTNPLTGDVQTTAAIAYNANAATIQTALEALSNVSAGDITVTGTGPYIYTATGNWAGHDIAPITVGVGSLTGGSSTMAQTTAGVDDFSRVGAVVQTSPFTIIELGAATPV